MYIQCRRHYRDPKLQFGHISRHLKVFLSTSIFGVGAHNHNHIIMEGSSNRPQLDFDGSSSSAAEQQRSPYHAQAKSQHLSSSSSSLTCDSSVRFDSVPRPINIIGDVLSRGRDEMKEGIRSLNQLQQTQALKQQGGVHVQNIKNLGSKLQKGDTKVPETVQVAALWPQKEDCSQCFHTDGSWNEAGVFGFLESKYWYVIVLFL